MRSLKVTLDLLQNIVVCSVILAATAFAQSPQRAQFPNETYSLVQVAEGVHAFIAPEPGSGIVQGNVTLIIGEESCLVVDTGQFPLLAERMVADIRKLTPKPVKYVLNTHWHGDHLLANVAFQKAWPSAAFISTGFTRRKIAEIYTEKFIAEQPVKLEEATKRIRLRVSEGKFSSGKVMTEDEKRYWAGEADVIDRTLPEFRLWKYVPPTLAFEKEITLDLGKREVRLMWLGRGNTAGDAITWVPDAKVLITGDTVVFPTPYGFGSYYGEWPAVLQQMIEMNAAAIVPGHGPVMKDYAYFKELIALFNDLTRQVKQAVGEGLSLEQTQKKVTMAEWSKRLAGDHKQRKADFEAYFVNPGVKRAYEEATGKMKEEGIE